VIGKRKARNVSRNIREMKVVRKVTTVFRRAVMMTPEGGG
jgi:hypothetical protein